MCCGRKNKIKIGGKSGRRKLKKNNEKLSENRKRLQPIDNSRQYDTL